MYELRWLRTDGSLEVTDYTPEQMAEYVEHALSTYVHNGLVTRLTIDTAFGTIEIIPQGGLSLLVE